MQWLEGSCFAGVRACLVELQLCQTSSGAAALPQSSSSVELHSQFGAEEMCLANITASAPQTANLVGFSSFALGFFSFWIFFVVTCC